MSRGQKRSSWETDLGQPRFVQGRDHQVREVRELFETSARVRDSVFDQIYPEELRSISKMHWTPVDVALRAAELLVVDQHTRVLDVGSGVGKFCMIGALSTAAQFTGVDVREHFVKFSRHFAIHYKIPRVKYVHSDMGRMDWSEYDSFYLFNPFCEVAVASINIDESLQVNEALHDRYVEQVKEKLIHARVGTRVATYHGFGGQFPDSYRLIHDEAFAHGSLEIWEKKA